MRLSKTLYKGKPEVLSIIMNGFSLQASNFGRLKESRGQVIQSNKLNTAAAK